MDFQTFLASFFTFLAYTLPLLLVLSHLGGADGWKLGPPFYSGLIACLATIAMTARISAFLDAQVAEPRFGWFSKESLIGLYVCFLAGVSLYVYGCLVPQMRQAADDVIALARPKGVVREFDLEDVANGPASPLWTIARSVIAMVLGLAAIALYLFWPSLILTIDVHREDRLALARKEAQHAHENERIALRRHALTTGRNANAVLVKLITRRDYCASEGCGDSYGRHIRSFVLEMDGFTVKPAQSGLYRVDDFAEVLTNREKAQLAHERVEYFARQWGAPFVRQSTLPAPAAFDAAAAEVQTDLSQQRSDRRLLDRFVKMLGSPAQMAILLAQDLTLAFALAMEMTALVLAFAIGSGTAKRGVA